MTSTADEMQAAGKDEIDVLFKLCEKVSRTEEIPNDWSRTTIVPRFKRNDETVCNNYRFIRLL